MKKIFLFFISLSISTLIIRGQLPTLPSEAMMLEQTIANISAPSIALEAQIESYAALPAPPDGGTGGGDNMGGDPLSVSLKDEFWQLLTGVFIYSLLCLAKSSSGKRINSRSDGLTPSNAKVRHHLDS